MARVNDGSQRFTCHPRIYPRMEWANLHPLRKHSLDGAARARQLTSGSAYYSSIDLERMKCWVGLVGWFCSGWFRLTHISGHPHNNNNNNPICKAPECQKTSVALQVERGTGKVRRSETNVLPLCNATDPYFFTARRYPIAYMLSSCVCSPSIRPSVYPSVTSRCSTKTAKPMITRYNAVR